MIQMKCNKNRKTGILIDIQTGGIWYELDAGGTGNENNQLELQR